MLSRYSRILRREIGICQSREMESCREATLGVEQGEQCDTLQTRDKRCSFFAFVSRYAVMPLLLSHRTIHSITTPLLYRDIRLIGQNRTYSFVLHSCPRDLRHIRSLKSRDIYKRGKGKQVGAWKVLTRRLEQASKLTGQTGKVVDLMAVKGAFHYCFDTRGDSIMDIRTAWAYVSCYLSLSSVLTVLQILISPLSQFPTD